jgi:hypothetical protein
MTDLDISSAPQEPPDSHEPIPAHVEAALVDSGQPYPPPLDQLLALGEAWRAEGAAERRAALGLNQSHVPDLVRMVRDRRLNMSSSESLEVWAPAHALLALADLDISAHFDELIRLFDLDDDFFADELPKLLAPYGASALAPLAAYLGDQSRWQYGRMRASEALAQIATRFPDLRDQAVALIRDTLAQATHNGDTLNGSLIADLLSLKATEALPTIRAAFELDRVEPGIAGDWATVQKDLGVKPDQSDPLVQRSRARWDAERREMRAMLGPLGASQPKPAASQHQRKAASKAKRKAAAKARKANKKRK